MALLLGGVTATAVMILQGNIRTADLTPMLGGDRPTEVAENPDGGRPVTVLVMGSDSREGENSFIGGGTETGAKSDTTLVVHMSADRDWATAVSIPRDSVVEVPDCIDPASGQVVPGSRRIFNDAFTTGGPACTIKTVESLTDLRIDDWVVIDFSGFTAVVDALGTVPICLSKPVNDTKHHIYLPAGRNEVDGETALAYVRERYTLGDGSDLGRIERQQAFLSSVLQKATSAGTLANPARTYAFLDAVTKSLVMNPELSSLPRLAAMAQDVQQVGLNNVQFLTVPNGPDPNDENRLVWTEQSADLWQALRSDRPITLDGESGAGDPAGSPTGSVDDPAPSTSTGPDSSGSASPSATTGPDSSGGSQADSPVVIDEATGRSADTDICA